MARPKPSPRVALAIRLIVAPLILAVVVGLLWWQHHSGSMLTTDGLLLLFGLGGGLEVARMLRHHDSGVSVWIGVVACALLGGIGFLSADAGVRMGWRVALVLLPMLALLLRHLRDVRPEALGAIAFSMVPVVYVGLPFSFMHELALGPDGALRLLFVVLVAKMSDIGGWVVGKPFGKHKLVPTVSPGKSWEGLAGGLAGSVAVAVLAPGLFGLPEAAWPLPGRIGFGLLIGLGSVLAGVTQSGWKRRIGVKDSSTLIPEMGGVLDMIDSLLLAAPLAYLAYA